MANPTTVRLGAHLGFYRVGSAQIPAPVQMAAKSVFFLAVPAGKKVPLTEIDFGHKGDLFIKTHSVAKSIARISKLKLNDLRLKAYRDLLSHQMSLCATQNPAKCLVYEEVSNATAYLHGSTSTLSTAFHAVQNYLKNRLAKDGHAFGDQIWAPIPMAILNSKGRELVRPGDWAWVSFSKVNLDPKYAKHSDDTTTLPPFDLATIHLSFPIGKPLVDSAVAAKPGERVFILGYPSATHDRARFGAPDSDGTSELVSFGRVRSFDYYERIKKGRVKRSPTQAAVEKIFGSMMTFSGADSFPGDSGGAMVNSNGQVLGTDLDSYPADGRATSHFISFGSNVAMPASKAAAIFSYFDSL